MSTTDPRIIAIRADDLIGRGSCSFVDECHTDAELVALLDQSGIRTPSESVAYFQIAHRVRGDYAEDVRNA